MRKQIILKRPINLMIPVWHIAPNKSFDRFPHNRDMVIVPFPVGTYERSMFDGLVFRGATADLETVEYLASCGYVPGMVDGELTDVTTGKDPETELN